MATIITSDCINCGACEPECPNNAISQGENIYKIDPQLCTECVGFHDYEACAAVCPVDCCITDPNNIESEEVLIARARALHKDIDFGENFPSRFRKGGGAAAPKPAAQAAAAAPAPQVAAAPAAEAKPAAAKPAGPDAAPAASPPPKPAPAAPPPGKEARPKKTFPNELPASFEEVSSRYRTAAPLSRGWRALVLFAAQPLLGALPHPIKKQLEDAVGNPIVFSAAGSTGLNVLHNVILYPVIAMAIAALTNGPQILFSQEINIFVLVGIILGALEGVWRLRDGFFYAKPAEEMTLRPAWYGTGLAVLLQPLLKRQTGVVREVPVPVDGFYSRGFVEKLERERRYGNVYTLEDRGGAYLLRLEFPRAVPDLGLPAQADLPKEMPDYDYDLALQNGQFIVRGKCPDERIRRISSSIGAFPPEFTTVIPLREKVTGFVHRAGNKLLEVYLVKEESAARAARQH